MSEGEDIRFLREALELATRTKGTDPDDAPIGAVIVHDGEIIATGVNFTVEWCDATAHAEIVAMRRAGEAVGKPRIEGAALYTTLQPCGMCTMAAIWAGITRIVYGARREDVHAMYFEDRHLSTLDFVADAYKQDLTLTGGVLAGECAKLYYRPWDDLPEEKLTNN